MHEKLMLITEVVSDHNLFSYADPKQNMSGHYFNFAFRIIGAPVLTVDPTYPRI